MERSVQLVRYMGHPFTKGVSLNWDLAIADAQDKFTALSKSGGSYSRKFMDPMAKQTDSPSA